MKILTTIELISILSEFPQNSIPVIKDEGKGHYSPLQSDEITLIDFAYFPRTIDKSILEKSGWKFDGDGELVSTPSFLELGWI